MFMTEFSQTFSMVTTLHVHLSQIFDITPISTHSISNSAHILTWFQPDALL